jgi:phospholipid-translocating ATPase
VATRQLRRPHDLDTFRGLVECENPNPDLGRFVGRLKVVEADGRTSVYPLGPENVVWRGTRLKNTDFVFGCAVYTGCDTKMSQNSKLKSNKFSRYLLKEQRELIQRPVQ